MPDETLRQWGENIRIFREQHDAHGDPIPPRLRGKTPSLTQAQLGQFLDPAVDQSTVARWERGMFEPRRRYKAQLAAVLHTDVRVLFAMTSAA